MIISYNKYYSYIIAILYYSYNIANTKRNSSKIISNILHTVLRYVSND